MTLTDVQLRNLKPRDRTFKISDGSPGNDQITGQ